MKMSSVCAGMGAPNNDVFVLWLVMYKKIYPKANIFPKLAGQSKYCAHLSRSH